jgi:hypothetical protein
VYECIGYTGQGEKVGKKGRKLVFKSLGDMWKWHSENPCRAILNKQKMSFFKNREQEDKTGPVWALVPVGGGGYKESV